MHPATMIVYNSTAG